VFMNGILDEWIQSQRHQHRQQGETKQAPRPPPRPPRPPPRPPRPPPRPPPRGQPRPPPRGPPRPPPAPRYVPFDGNVNNLISNAIPQDCIVYVQTVIHEYFRAKERLMRAFRRNASDRVLGILLSAVNKFLVGIRSKLKNGDNTTNPPCPPPVTNAQFNTYWRAWMNNEVNEVEAAMRAGLALNQHHLAPQFTRYGGRKRTRKRKSRKRKSRKRKSRKRKSRKKRKSRRKK
jgi:hypothetical protein